MRLKKRDGKSSWKSFLLLLILTGLMSLILLYGCAKKVPQPKIVLSPPVGKLPNPDPPKVVQQEISGYKRLPAGMKCLPQAVGKRGGFYLPYEDMDRLFYREAVAKKYVDLLRGNIEDHNKFVESWEKQVKDLRSKRD